MARRKPHIPKFSELTDKFVKTALKTVEDAIGTFAEKEKDVFIQRIRDQKFPSFRAFPLSARHVERKKALGLPVSTMIATGTYLAAIKVHKEPDIAKTGVTRTIIGIDPLIPAVDMETKQKRRDISVASVAFINEYGAPRANIPARPHWGPFFTDLKKDAKTEQKRLAGVLTTEWAKALGQTTKK